MITNLYETTAESGHSSIARRQWLFLLGIHAALLPLVFLEKYLLLVVVISVFATLLLFFHRLANGIILLPIFLFVPFEVAELGGIHFSKLGVILLALSAGGTILLSRLDQKFELPAAPALALILIGGLFSIVNAKNVGVSVVILLKQIEAFILIFFLTVNFIAREDDIRRVLTAIVFGGLLASLYGIIQFAFMHTSRVFGLHGGVYGAFIGTAIITAAAIAIYGRPSVIRYAFIFILPFMILALLLSQTRAWTFGTLTALVFLVYLHRSKSGKTKIAFILLLLVGTTLVLVQFGLLGLISTGSVEAATQKALQTGLLESDERGKLISAALRLFIWWHGLQIYFQHPLLGFGIGNLRFKNVFTGEVGPADDPTMAFVDNHYLNILAETGLLGTIGWIWLMVLVFRECKVLVYSVHDVDQRASTYAIIGSLVVWAVGGFFWVLNNLHESTAMLALLMGLAFAMRKFTPAKT